MDLPRLVGNTKPGSKSTLSVFRRGGQRDLTVVVAELEPDQAQRKSAAPEPAKPQASAAAQNLGLTLIDLTAAEKKALDLKGGAKVVAAEGPAARAGLREDDVIVQVVNVEVNGVKDVEAALSRADRTKPVSVLFRRGEWAQYAIIRPVR